MNELLITLLLSLVPSFEARYAIPASLALTDLNPMFVFLACVLLNFVVIPVVFIGLEWLAPPIRRKVDWIDSIFEWFWRRGRGKNWEVPALVFFVSTPIPGTGAYTGVLMAYLFKLDRMKSAVAVAVGVVISSVVTTLSALGIISLAGVFG
ncbi:hypothetical protein AKJ63_01800 [candidate division MSBL1 archaeon SCGC-AAA259D18]|uniref:Ligand-binding protein SH3 n=1 Tax=candidate division MSBL1 archaeon SCGC-AAA259D18 TaxID=1698262 RepID=A0A133UAG6_9EURY|nr:hypothetical protein AKJ63_01800 [candidate division MSBL1 archaeon SCGC-AAA259D18]